MKGSAFHRRFPHSLFTLVFVLGLGTAGAAQSHSNDSTWQSPRIVSADGRNEIVFEGLFQATGSWIESGRDPRTNFGLKRMRPEFSGRFADTLRFRLEPNFSADAVELEEAWIGVDVLGGNALAMAGRMKVPFGLEELRNRRHINFPRFSILNQFSPSEDHGLFLFGHSPSNLWEYGFAITNGTGAEDTSSSKDLAARVMAHPFENRPTSIWRNLQVGVAATFGTQYSSLGGFAVENAAGQDVIKMATGTRLAGERTRLGLELAWFRGPWFLQAEHINIVQDMSGVAGSDAVRFKGTYLELAHVLTGERKTFAGVLPDLPFDPSTGGGRGAWVLAARYSDLHSDSALVSEGLVLPGTYTGNIRSASLGLNWVLNRHVILRHAYVHSFYADAVTAGGRTQDDEGALLLELQLHF
jgi:phosphate-selective porin OprO/OprP